MREPKVIFPILILVNACIWGFTILMVSHALRGTGAYQEIENILSGAAGISTVILGGGAASVLAFPKSDRPGPGGQR